MSEGVKLEPPEKPSRWERWSGCRYSCAWANRRTSLG